MEPNKLAAIEWAQHRMDEEFIILDVETNAWGKGIQSEVIQIGIINKYGDVLLNAMICPNGEVQQQATDLHGITNETLRGAAPFKAMWPVIANIIIRHETVIAYNAKFDRGKLLADVERWELSDTVLQPVWGCAMLAFAEYHGERHPKTGDYKWQKLDTAVDVFDIDIPRELHDATLDVRLTLEVIKAMAALGENDND